jgi:hypothetical protein
MEVLLVIIGICVFAVLAYLGHQAEMKRRAAFQAFADKHGLNYDHTRDRELAKRYSFIDQIRRGSSRYAYNVLSGVYKDVPIRVFDFHYATRSTDSKGNTRTQHHYCSFYMLRFEKDFPELRITHEGLFSKLIQAIGFDDIDFESHAFSKRYNVKSNDKKFAYDVCNARMIDYLLDNDDLEFEIEGNLLAVGVERKLDVAVLGAKLDRLLELRERLPNYLFTTP